MTVKPKRNRLGQALVFYRAAKSQGVRDVAAEMGLSAATLSRIERGYAPDAASLIKVWQWMIEPFDGARAPVHQQRSAKGQP